MYFEIFLFIFQKSHFFKLQVLIVTQMDKFLPNRRNGFFLKMSFVVITEYGLNVTRGLKLLVPTSVAGKKCKKRRVKIQQNIEILYWAIKRLGYAVDVFYVTGTYKKIRIWICSCLAK